MFVFGYISQGILDVSGPMGPGRPAPRALRVSFNRRMGLYLFSCMIIDIVGFVSLLSMKFSCSVIKAVHHFVIAFVATLIVVAAVFDC